MCKFCKDEITPNLIILESRLSRVIANYFPMGTVALLVTPKRHITSITDLTLDELSDISYLLFRVTTIIKTKIKPSGITIELNEGDVAGQTISHLHYHVIAREQGDGLENLKRIKPKTPIMPEELLEIKSLF